ncbi:S53 family peptidase [Noviherbaspirillum pedocola]|nr:S53 family peptidase [Noviherbaspirillum pedocola]
MRFLQSSTVAFALTASIISLNSAYALPQQASSVAQQAADEQANDPVGHAREGMTAPPGHARPPFRIHGNGPIAPISATPQAVTAPNTSRTPANVRHTYGFDKIANQGAGQTIAIVDAYDDPNIESDLNSFSQAYGLPSCVSSTGCFTKLYAAGSQPAVDGGWSLEIALDVQWAHAIAPQARILLVEAKSSSMTDLMAAVDVAVKNGASVVSMSFGGPEFSGQSYYDSHFSATGVTFVAASGDSGHGVDYPAASRMTVSAGGTTLNADAYGNYISEAAWNGSGGGVSSYSSEPSGQTYWPLPYASHRGVPDVSYNADPASGVPVYTSVPYNGQTGWFQMGGTSAAAPQWAALFAIVNAQRTAAGKARLASAYNALYTVGKSSYANYRDVTSGSNGSCGAVCQAAGSYDYVTGLGSPNAGSLVPALVNY